jgi:ElaB/YqjD/DUF883 family membrane-anchored ribosome-binding protein
MDNKHEVTGAQLGETRAALSEKLETLEQQVVDTVHGATNAAAQTVDIVKDAVHETVAAVKDTLDLRLQVDRHPWAMVGGSMALGLVGGYLLFRRGATPPAANGRNPPAPLDTPRKSALRNGDVTDSQPVSGAEIAKLKELAIGTFLGLMRDMITQSAPEPMKPGLAYVIDGITVKLGGEPIHGPVANAG